MILKFIKWMLSGEDAEPQSIITEVSENSVIIEYDIKIVREIVFKLNEAQFLAALSVKAPHHLIINESHPKFGGYALTIRSEPEDKKIEV